MIKLIVGLGNPGDRYQKTRHNAGFWLLDQLAAGEGGRLAEDKKFQGEYGKITLAQQPLHLLKPLTFMATAVTTACATSSPHSAARISIACASASTIRATAIRSWITSCIRPARWNRKK